MYKAKKLFLDIDKMHEKYRKIRTEYEGKRREALRKVVRRMRDEGRKRGLGRWRERTRGVRKAEQGKKGGTMVRPGVGRPSALNITPSWKAKVRRTEPMSAVLEPTTPTRGPGPSILGKELLRRRSTIKTRLDLKDKFEIGSKSEIKEISSPETDPSTPDSDLVLRLRRK